MPNPLMEKLIDAVKPKKIYFRFPDQESPKLITRYGAGLRARPWCGDASKYVSPMLPFLRGADFSDSSKTARKRLFGKIFVLAHKIR